MSYQSKYNVYDASGRLVYRPGDTIDEAEAIRQGIARPSAETAPADDSSTPATESAQNKRAPKSARK